MNLYDYDKLMAQGPSLLGTVYGEVKLYEHPERGDSAPVIGVCHKRKLAWDTSYYDPWQDQGDCEDILAQYQELTELT